MLTGNKINISVNAFCVGKTSPVYYLHKKPLLLHDAVMVNDSLPNKLLM